MKEKSAADGCKKVCKMIRTSANLELQPAMIDHRNKTKTFTWTAAYVLFLNFSLCQCGGLCFGSGYIDSGSGSSIF